MLSISVLPCQVRNDHRYGGTSVVGSIARGHYNAMPPTRARNQHPLSDCKNFAEKARMNLRTLVLWLAALVVGVGNLQAQNIKVIVDQDARGPATTDMQSILIFLQSDKFDVLGITTVSGDQWVKEETQR